MSFQLFMFVFVFVFEVEVEVEEMIEFSVDDIVSDRIYTASQ
jgi:hypothetical protein